MTRFRRWYTRETRDAALSHVLATGGVLSAYIPVHARPVDKAHCPYHVDWSEPGRDNPCQWIPPHLCGEETK